jgi:hypothetical protein
MHLKTHASIPERLFQRTERHGIMHEEYRPGYNWEDMIDKEFKKSIPWGDVDDSGEEPDTTLDCEEPDS